MLFCAKITKIMTLLDIFVSCVHDSSRCVAAPALTQIRLDDVEHNKAQGTAHVFNVIMPDLEQGQRRRCHTLASWYCRERKEDSVSFPSQGTMVTCIS